MGPAAHSRAAFIVPRPRNIVAESQIPKLVLALMRIDPRADRQAGGSHNDQFNSQVNRRSTGSSNLDPITGPRQNDLYCNASYNSADQSRGHSEHQHCRPGSPKRDSGESIANRQRSQRRRHAGCPATGARSRGQSSRGVSSRHRPNEVPATQPDHPAPVFLCVLRANLGVLCG